MKKIIVAGLSLAALAAGAVQAQAQPRYDDNRQIQRQREEVRQDRRELREDRQDLRQDQRQFRRAQKRFHAGRYQAPRGYQHRSWRYGDRLPSGYYTSRYAIRDYGRYGLYTPPRGYQWTRVGNDAVLVAIASGIVGAAIAELFD